MIDLGNLEKRLNSDQKLRQEPRRDPELIAELEAEVRESPAAFRTTSGERPSAPWSVPASQSARP